MSLLMERSLKMVDMTENEYEGLIKYLEPDNVLIRVANYAYSIGYADGKHAQYMFSQGEYEIPKKESKDAKI